MRRYLNIIFTSPGFIVVVAFLVRLAFLFPLYRHYGETAITDNVLVGLWGETGNIANAIANGHGFSSPLKHFQTGPTAWLTPIFPYMVAGIFKLCGTQSYASGVIIHVLDLIFSAFTCWPIYILGTKVFGKTTGIAAAWAWVFCPTAIYFPLMWVWDTALAGLLLPLLLIATLNLRGSDKARFWMGYGALWALGAMVNASLVVVLPFLGLWAIWPLRHRFAHATRLAVLSSLIFAAGLAPWTVRNYAVFHRFIPLRSNFALEFWLGNNPTVLATWSPDLHPNENTEEGLKYVRMTEIPYMDEKFREGLAFIRNHPLEDSQFMFRRFAETWMGMWDSPFDVWKYVPLSLRLAIVWNIWFSVFSMLGVLFAYRAGKKEALPFGAVMVAFPFLFYLTHPSLRYRYPIDPLMQILSVYAMVYICSKLAQRWHEFRPAADVEPAAHGAD